MRNVVKNLLTGVCFASVMAVSAVAQDIRIPHRQGEVTLTATPQKVLVMDWAAVDTLDAMGVQVSGVPGSNAPTYLKKYEGDDYLKIGSLVEPDVEMIAAADADLMIVGARSRKVQPQLNEILPTVDLSIDNGDFIESVKANITELGAVFGKEDRAAEMVAELDGKVARLREAAEGQGRALTLVASGGKLGVYGPDSRTGWLHNEIGFPAVMDDVDDRSDRGDAASYELILEANPDWMFVVDRDAAIGSEGASPAETLLDNELVHQTTAWKNGNIVYLNPQEAYIVMNGYQAISDLLDQVYDAVSKG
ncbi:siderophore ABC transporter substrate-binding protein [Falsirhodobacter sp. alg1]|uniref:siderophore ABC transporter substrate-binding protein n=1 Tax=Falsirhodobacter sp. alg1 TaxID=1472418 RepID=UPI0005EE9BB6|nr:siderophore ABC transporter substrate-binding protein [Falsirhodobacter sp. alg1]